MELYSYKYSIPYLIFMGYLFVLMFVEFRKINRQQSTRSVRVLTIAGFLFFFGLRGFIYSDWYSYYPFFEEIGTLWDGNMLPPAGYNKEIGFVIYSAIIKSIFPNYFFWVFISCLIDILILNAVFKRYVKYYVLAFIVFFVLGGCLIEINLMRNIKAIFLFIISIKYIQERRFVPFLLLTMLAISFHISAIVYIPMYFLLHRKYSKTLLWATFIVGNIIFLLQIEYVQPMLIFLGDLLGGRITVLINGYLANNMYNYHYGFSIGYFERALTYMLVMLCYNRLLQQNKTNLIFINAYVLYFFFFFFCSEIKVITERLPFLFIFSYWILYPQLFEMVKLRMNKLVVLPVFMLFFSLKIAMGNSNLFAKYDNLLFGIKSYEERKELFETYGKELVKRK
jgi:hypothetical protein